MVRLLSVIFTVLFSISAEMPIGGIRLIKSIVDHYKAQTGVEAEIKKQVTLAMLDETKKSLGTMAFSKGKLRIDIKEPEPVLIILNEKMIWVVTPADKNLGNKTQVLKVKNDKKRAARAPVAALLSSPKAWDLFKIKSEKKIESEVLLQLVPKKRETMGEVVQVEVLLNPKLKEIRKISLRDELENETTYEFSAIKFDARFNNDKFLYNPPADAQVTEY